MLIVRVTPKKALVFTCVGLFYKDELKIWKIEDEDQTEK